MTKRPFPLDSKTILDLQRTAGNQYVARLLRGQAAHTANAPQPAAAEAVTPLAVEPVMAEPLRETPAPRRVLAGYSSFIGPVVIGLVTAIGIALAFLREFPAVPQPGAIGAAAACGTIAWYTSRRLLYHWKSYAARARL